MFKRWVKKFAAELNNDVLLELNVIRLKQSEIDTRLADIQLNLALLTGAADKNSQVIEHIQNVRAYQVALEQNIGNVVDQLPAPPPALTGRGNALNRRR